MQLWGLWLCGWQALICKEYLIVIGNEPADLLEDYDYDEDRNSISRLKGRGFDLESCRLSKERRLSHCLFFALGLCWCLKLGPI